MVDEAEPSLAEALEEIVAAVPEVRLSELMPQAETLSTVAATEALHAALTASGRAVTGTDQAQAALKQAVQAELAPGLERTAFGPDSSLAIDTANPTLERADAAADMRRRWVSEARESLGFSPSQAESLLSRAVDSARSRHSAHVADTRVNEALHELTRTQAHFTRDHFWKAVSRRPEGTPLTRPQLEAALERALADPARVVPLGVARGQEHFSTLDVHRAEAQGT